MKARVDGVMLRMPAIVAPTEATAQIGIVSVSIRHVRRSRETSQVIPVARPIPTITMTEACENQMTSRPAAPASRSRLRLASR